jgi:hypothetical protein
MAFIRQVEPHQAEGRTREVYAEIMERWKGRMPSVMKIVGLNPEALQKLKDLCLEITFGGSTLGRRREEMLATAVSTWNGCPY